MSCGDVLSKENGLVDFINQTEGLSSDTKLLAEEIMRAMGDEYGKEIKGFI